MCEEAVRNLLSAVWYQALKDFKKDKRNDDLRDWIINEGCSLCVPRLSKREVREILNEYLSK